MDHQINEGILTNIQAAKYLTLHINTLKGMMKRNEIPFYRVGLRRIVFKKSELDEFINSRKNVACIKKT